MGGAATYSIDQLAPLIQKGLYIYDSSKAKVTEALRPKIEDKLHIDDEGKQVTKAVKKGASMDQLAVSFDNNKE
jgi:hypothetical protein